MATNATTVPLNGAVDAAGAANGDVAEKASGAFGPGVIANAPLATEVSAANGNGSFGATGNGNGSFGATSNSLHPVAVPTVNAHVKGKNPFRPLGVMLKRNWILYVKRYWRSTVAQIFVAPLFFLLLLWGLQQADYRRQLQSNRHPAPYDLPGLITCQGPEANDPCINLLFTPDTPQIRTFLTGFSEANAQVTKQPRWEFEPTIAIADGPQTVMGMVPMASADSIYDYLLMHPNYTSWAVVFNISSTPTDAPNFRYQIWFNTSQTGNGSDLWGGKTLAFTKMMDQSIISSSGALVEPANIIVTLKDWPRIPPNTVNDGIVQQLGPVFFFCAAMVVFINILNTIVAEKEQRLRQAMEVMGLSKTSYWLSYFITYLIEIMIASLVTCCFGLAFGFQAFRNCNFAVLYITFFLFGVAMNAFAFFITTLVRKSSVSVLVGIFLFIIGLLFESFIFSSTFVGYVWWEPGTTDPAGWIVLIFVPFFNFGKMFLDITVLTTGRPDPLTDTFIPGPGFPWSALYEPIPNAYLPYYGNGAQPQVPPPVESWYWLIMNVGFYMILLCYFDNVIPDEFGRSEPLYFFLLPSYWGISRSNKSKSAVATDDDGHKEWMDKTLTTSSKGKEIVLHPDTLEEDDDVAAEKAMALDPNSKAEMRILGLRKEYRANMLWKTKKDKIALDGLYLNFQEGSLLALLGQNGAGKTTTMNILSGLTPSTSGDALIYGQSVARNMDAIRAQMGICPQHDILFNDLTAEEHIQLYAGLKGIPEGEMQQLTEERLEAVRLWNVKTQRAGTYSGGMKRRLSMVISTIGDPKIIFMDEPTTGMDPVNRRHVWSFVERFKKGRVIVLTTHSMEEADVLGDKIAIMAHGRLRAIGSSIRLKSKFGAGYRISVVTDADPANMERAKALVVAQAPGLKLEDDSAGALIFNLATDDVAQIPMIVDYLDLNPDGFVRAWGMSQSTLEEVFLKLIRDVEGRLDPALEEDLKALKRRASVAPPLMSAGAVDAQTMSPEMVQMTEMNKLRLDHGL